MKNWILPALALAVTWAGAFVIAWGVVRWQGDDPILIVQQPGPCEEATRAFFDDLVQNLDWDFGNTVPDTREVPAERLSTMLAEWRAAFC